MKYKVLVVDDEKLVRWSVGQALSDHNCEVELCSSGEEAVEKAKLIKFDLVVSDLKMDGINGVEAIKQIKKISPETKAVVITAYGTEKDAWDARNEGILLWMTKPFQIKDFIRYVHDLLARPGNTDITGPEPPKPIGHNGNRFLNLLAMVCICQLLLMSLVSAQSTTIAPLKTKYNLSYLYSIKDAGIKSEKLDTPCNIYFDTKEHELYVVDLGSRRVFSYDTNGIMNHEWRNFGKVKNPNSVALDSRGNLYVSDISQPLVAVTNYFGSVVGYLNIASITSTKPEQILIQKILIDKKDRIYIGENRGNQIFVIDPLTGNLIQKLGGSGNKETSIQSFADMVFDDRGNLIVLDGARNEIMVINPEGELIQAYGKSGGSPYTLGKASGLNFDPLRKWTFVTDASRHCVLVFDQYGECFYEFGGLGLGRSFFYFPRGIAIDENEHIYVLEPTVNRIQVFTIEPETTGKEVNS